MSNEKKNPMAEEILNLIKEHNLTWDEFKTSFENVHDYLIENKDKYPWYNAPDGAKINWDDIEE